MELWFHTAMGDGLDSPAFRDSGFGFGFRVSGFGLALHFEIRVWGLGFGFRVSGFGFRVSAAFRVSGFGLRASGLGG